MDVRPQFGNMRYLTECDGKYTNRKGGQKNEQGTEWNRNKYWLLDFTTGNIGVFDQNSAINTKIIGMDLREIHHSINVSSLF